MAINRLGRRAGPATRPRPAGRRTARGVRRRTAPFLRRFRPCAVRSALASTKLPAAEEALASDETTEALPFSLLPAETPPTTLAVDECPVVVTLAVVGGVLLVDTTADEPADAMLAVAVVGGAVVGVDVLWGAVPPALLREAVAAAPALAAPLLGASSLAPAPR